MLSELHLIYARMVKPVRATVCLSLSNGDSGMLTVGSIKGEMFFFSGTKSMKGKGTSSIVKGLCVMLLNSEICWEAGKGQ